MYRCVNTEQVITILPGVVKYVAAVDAKMRIINRYGFLDSLNCLSITRKPPGEFHTFEFK